MPSFSILTWKLDSGAKIYIKTQVESLSRELLLSLLTSSLEDGE